MSFFLFDIGGTKMRFALSPDGEGFNEPLILDNPGEYELGLKMIEDAFKKFTSGNLVSVVSGGIAGTFNKERTIIINAPHLSDWVGKNIVKDLHGIFHAPILIENDSAIVGLGEAVSGAGKDFDIVMYLTISTGVGGARIVSKKIDKTSRGFEPGHQIIDFSAVVEPRFNVAGTLEEFVSGTALARRMGVAIKDISRDNPVWKDLAEQLAYGVYNSILHWSPDVVVLGGSMITGDPAIPLDLVIKYMKDINRVYDVLPEVKMAELEDVGGLYGALAHLKQ